MDEKITKAIECLADMVNHDVSADDALKYTQAACNLANTRATLTQIEINKQDTDKRRQLGV